MPRFTHLPTTIEAEQFTDPLQPPKGVCSCHFDLKPHVHVRPDETVRVQIGDWIVPEPGSDGAYFYPISPDTFKAAYIDAASSAHLLLAPLLHVLSDEIGAINEANGWKRVTPGAWAGSDHHVPAVLALIHSEVSEALEAFRHNDIENFREELADVVIRVIDCAGGLELELGAAVIDKLAKNRERGHHHGGKRV